VQFKHGGSQRDRWEWQKSTSNMYSLDKGRSRFTIDKCSQIRTIPSRGRVFRLWLRRRSQDRCLEQYTRQNFRHMTISTPRPIGLELRHNNSSMNIHKSI
jgi:hypothetical protein